MLGNLILDTLPDHAQQELRPFLRRVFLPRGDVGDPPLSDALLFPIDALVRSSLPGENGRRITVMAMGRRCAAGLGRWWGESAAADIHVLEPGNAWVLPIDQPERSRHERILGPALNSLAYRTLMVTATRIACNVEHNVDRRLAQALLWIADETGRPHVSLTHQMLSELTAMRRPSVSLVLSDLQRRGMVRTVHGSIGILDRKRLEGEACTCYHATRKIMRVRPAPV